VAVQQSSTRITTEAELPAAVLTANLKLHLNIDSTDQDALLAVILAQCTALAEDYTGRALTTQTWELWTDGFPVTLDYIDKVRSGIPATFSFGADSYIELPRAPLVSITHLKTYNTSNTVAEFAAASYYTDTTSTPGRLVLNDGYSWPTDLRARNAVVVQYVAGYGATYASVPAAIRMGIMQMAEEMWGNRIEGTERVPQIASQLLSAYRIEEL